MTLSIFHIYFHTQVNMREAEFMLLGSDSYAARFGATIADLGDIDDDGCSGNTRGLKYSK